MVGPKTGEMGANMKRLRQQSTHIKGFSSTIKVAHITIHLVRADFSIIADLRQKCQYIMSLIVDFLDNNSIKIILYIYIPCKNSFCNICDFFSHFNDYSTDPFLIIIAQNIHGSAINETVFESIVPRLSIRVDHFAENYILGAPYYLPSLFQGHLKNTCIQWKDLLKPPH